MMDSVELDKKIYNIVFELIEKKVSCIESDTIEFNSMLIEYLQEQIRYYDKHVKSLKYEKNRNRTTLDVFFQKSIKQYGGQA